MSSAVLTTDAASATTRDWRELATRESDGLAVSLEWSQLAGRVRVVVADARLDQDLEFDVAGADANAAFYHPFAYAPAEASASAMRCAGSSMCSRRAERST